MGIDWKYRFIKVNVENKTPKHRVLEFSLFVIMSIKRRDANASI